LICGLSVQTMPAIEVEQLGRPAAARKLWKLTRTSTKALGGRPSPVMLVGHLCQVCDEAVTKTGSIGPSALERALVAHLTPSGLGKLGYDLLQISGVMGWGAPGGGGTAARH
jgi:hypothetical protein